MDKKITYFIVVGTYTELLVPKHLLPLQLRFKPNNMIEYHIYTKDPDIDKLLELFNKWFVGFELQKVLNNKEQKLD